MENARVAILGAGGQIGSFLVGRLSKIPGLEVVPVCRNAVSAGFIDAMGYRARVGTVDNICSARRIVGDCDVVINCAIAVGLPREARHLNEGIIDSMVRLPNIRMVVHFSSVAVYGSCIDPSRSTFESPRPDSDYGKDKLNIEKTAAKAFARRGLTYYVLRLGHVYGAHQAMSSAIVTMLTTRPVALPFSGNVLSNAIHIEEVGQAVVRMLDGTHPSGVYNLSDLPHRTWRDVFDWHSNTLSLPVAGSLEDHDSSSRRIEILRSLGRPTGVRLLLESAQWLRSLPSSYLSSCPALRDFTYAALRHLPASLGRRLKAVYVESSAKRAVAERNVPIEAEPWLFSNPMPGPYFEYAPGSDVEVSRAQSMARQLCSWYQGFASPVWDSEGYRQPV